MEIGMSGKAEGISHVCLNVPDVDAAVHFYCEGLGLALVRRDETGAIVKTPDGVIMEIVPGPGGGDKSGITHVCYNTFDVDAAFERALEFGAVRSRESDPEPYTYKDLRMAFVRTPSGEGIEFWSIMQKTGSFGEPVQGNRHIKQLVHVALTVPDMAACVRFYEGLGVKLKVDWEWGCSMTLPDGRELELFTGGEYAKEAKSYTHFCLLTDDVRRAQERVVEMGGAITHEPYDWSNLEVGFCTGVGGEVVEFFRMYADGRTPDVFEKAPDKLPNLFAEAPRQE